MSGRYALVLVAVAGMWHVLPLLAAEPVIIAREEGNLPLKQPQLACAADGSIHLAYGMGDNVFYSRSNDGGRTFSPATEALRCPNLSLGMRRGPRIAVAGTVPVITAIGGPKGKGQDGDLQAWRLAAANGAWSGPTSVNDAPASAREGLHGMAAGPDGSVWCTWLDLRSGKTEIYAAHSTDGGATWGPNLLAYHSPDGSVCECCHPSIAVDAAGKVSILFRNSLGGNRDMYLTTSADGKKFAPAKKLGTGTWKLNACPMDGGMLAVDGKGRIDTAWRREKSLFLTTGGTKETPLGPGEQPWIASTTAGTVAVWTSRREGDLWMLRPQDKQPTKLASEARDPVVATVAGKDQVVVCWEGRADGRRAVLASVVDIK
ncbi:MAG TPA: sialidase family protein [Planctomycetaceae bacterium]|nr:sialidase family protein [Planctomycetaceae bacterium]